MRTAKFIENKYIDKRFKEIAHVVLKTGLIGLKSNPTEIGGVLFVTHSGESRFLADKELEFSYKEKVFAIELRELVQLLVNLEFAKKDTIPLICFNLNLKPKSGKRYYEITPEVICNNFSLEGFWDKALKSDLNS